MGYIARASITWGKLIRVIVFMPQPYPTDLDDFEVRMHRNEHFPDECNVRKKQMWCEIYCALFGESMGEWGRGGKQVLYN